jgi:hypothetical protein
VAIIDEHATRLLQSCFWEMRRLIESELRELTEAQERLDAFVNLPTPDRRDALASDLAERVRMLSRTNEQVLRLLYDASDNAQKLAKD